MTDIPNISKRHCDSCGVPLLDGELFYHCRTEIIAGKDETIPDLKHPDKLIAQALSEISGKDEEELLAEIYQEIILQLCPTCRITFLKLVQSMLGKGCAGCAKCGPPPAKKEGKLLQFPAKREDSSGKS
ncbi:MAG: hypothetical protein KKD01_00125 [Proteobacteria bacterium]|nr:hypothetical protein [Pseudomonadota bacterium]MBU1233182.1 hypothetical protein [Pseudomonadota bacterium]MBU1417551.1 hypothetical protein [Pseudomonadota bacterium]MBU1453102.1 hypothetical protein [Pseudomonadota bacterium]